MDDYTKAIELNPKYTLACNNRGNLYKDLKRYMQAIEDYTRAIELDPKNGSTYYNRGIIYGLMRYEDQALEDYKRAARLEHRAAQDLLRNKGISW